ncbi:MAG: rhomboid family intramembrane serine protease [Candidatus Aminicenantes bacterium]|nr:rhomboid family intramembrane serine protease [Candidatus Aminicenantes bacterium]
MFLPLRDENPTRRFPALTVLLIAVNVAVFAAHVFSPATLTSHVLRMGAIPYEITHFTVYQGYPVERIFPVLALFASMFLHGSLLHLLGNMLYLWIFGNNVEDFLGPVRFILFYLVSGLAAAGTHILAHPHSTIPMIGASGAIAGVLGAYFVLYPGARVQTLVFFSVVPIPAAIILGLWFLGQVLNVGIGGGVAWFAHIGGFLAGLVFIRYFPRKRRFSRTSA